MKPGHECDQSGVTVAVVPALSPQPAKPVDRPKSVVLAVPPESTLLPVAAAMTSPEAGPHQWQHAVLQS